MRVVIQRVNQASVKVEGILQGEIDQGLCIFFGVEKGAEVDDLTWLVHKVVNLRIFNDKEGKMNLSVKDVEGDIILISQFTLHASTRKGNRPSFIQSEGADRADEIYQECIKYFEQKLGKSIQTGVFGGDMKVSLENDGPVTILIDTEEKW